MRCMISGTHHRSVSRMCYGGFRRYLPRDHPARGEGAQRETRRAPVARTHAGIVASGRKADANPHLAPIKGVMGSCVFTWLPYFSMVTSWVLDTPMHLVKGVMMDHIFPALLGKRQPSAKLLKDTVDILELQQCVLQHRRLDLTTKERLPALRRANDAYEAMAGPRGLRRNRPRPILRMDSKSIFNSHELLEFVESSAKYILRIAIEDDEVIGWTVCLAFSFLFSSSSSTTLMGPYGPIWTHMDPIFRFTKS